MKTETSLKQILEKYEQGNCSTQEEEMLHNYFESFQDSEDVWSEIGIGKKEVIHKQILQNVEQRVQNQKPSRNLLFKIAASIVLALGIGFLIVKSSSTNTPVEVSIITKSATLGQKATFKLPDGSEVRLNSGSSLSYPATFSTIREVKLVGEAFFEVTKNPNKKFIVSTGGITTTVLGTSFNVSAYPDEELKVTVETGKVGVASNNQQVELVPGQQATYQLTNKILSMSKVDIANFTSWRNGILKFNGNSLPEITKELERWYGIDIEFESEQDGNCDLKLEFDNQSLTQVLHQLESVTGIHVELNKNLVKITGVGCKN